MRSAVKDPSHPYWGGWVENKDTEGEALRRLWLQSKEATQAGQNYGCRDGDTRLAVAGSGM